MVPPFPDRSLGLVIRLIEAYFGAVILSVLGYALVMAPDEFAYDATLIHVMAALACASCSLWLIEKRARITRVFVIVSMAIVVVLSVIDLLFGGEYDRIAGALGETALIAGIVLYFVISLLIIGYFAWSPRVRQVFTLPLEGTGDKPIPPDSQSGAGEDIYERPFSWPWIRNLIIYYCAFSILGHWAEIGFCWLIVLGVFQGDYDFSQAHLWSQWLYPYPAEGIAMVLIVLILFPIKQWFMKRFNGRWIPALILSFLVNAFVCTAIDFTLGVTVNYDYHLWDYRELPFNFMGQIVLQNSMVYSIAATFIVWVLYPLMAKLLHRSPKPVVDGLFWGFVAFYAFLEVLYFIHLTPAGLIIG